MKAQVLQKVESAPRVRVASYISGAGMYVPEKIVGNGYFASYLDTSDEWIRERTGIEERRFAETGATVSQLAEPACRSALAGAGLEPGDVGGIVFATATPDYVFPGAAACLQHRLGMRSPSPTL